MDGNKRNNWGIGSDPISAELKFDSTLFSTAFGWKHDMVPIGKSGGGREAILFTRLACSHSFVSRSASGTKVAGSTSYQAARKYNLSNAFPPPKMWKSLHLIGAAHLEERKNTSSSKCGGGWWYKRGDRWEEFHTFKMAPWILKEIALLLLVVLVSLAHAAA